MSDKELILGISDNLRDNIISEDRAFQLLRGILGTTSLQRCNDLIYNSSREAWKEAKGSIAGFSSWWEERNKININRV